MRMQREAGDPDGPVIRGFAGNGYRIDEGAVVPALLMTVDSAVGWSPPPIAVLTIDALEGLFSPAPEFVLFGTGAALVRPPVALVRSIEARGFGVEAMDSRAAARAWGVLRAEGRVIAAVLYPLDA